MFDKLLVANRGEIAVRVIRAAKELGLRTVAVFSDADKDSLAVRFADEAVRIGPPPAAKSYLDGDAIIAAARETGAGAIHPGYGFLSENARFADAVAAAGLVFVGPEPATIRIMGDKAAARAAAQAAGVPIVPGTEGEVADLSQALAAARGIGFPVMLKASAGGGGRGIRVAADEAAFAHHFHTAQAEAAAAFGRGALYLERFLNRARHIEVQVLGDGKRVLHCFERECSLQRRRQKIWEEAPSTALDDVARQALCASAVRLAERVHYRGAGTLEYLYDDSTGEFFFIEMNTRIQVEHPVTEMITGIDLVREMILIAQGEPLKRKQPDVIARGAAIEVRINAEDPDKNFRPSPGRITTLALPGGPGVRVDTMLYPGYAVPPYYDSLLAKIIVHAETRPQALSRLSRALDEFAIEGVITTAPLHKRLVQMADVQAGRFDTGFLERFIAGLNSPPAATRLGVGAEMSAIRYSFGGDEHVFAEIDEEMSLEAFFKGMAICTELQKRRLPGVSEICPSNASYLVRFDPDVIHPDKMLGTLKEIEAELGSADLELSTRIIEIPVFYNDPWTHETLMRFRERHQDPSSTDLEYGARINGYKSVDDFIAAHASAPWFVSMVGFVAGLPFLFQMVEREKQIEVPKYLRPRTDTPKLTVGHGGCFTAIYSVRGAGGYQLFGITPAPIYDPEQKLPYLKDFMAFFRPGDIVKWKPISRDEYDRDIKAVEAGTFDLKIRPVNFSLKSFLADPGGYSRHLVEVLYGH